MASAWVEEIPIRGACRIKQLMERKGGERAGGMKEPDCADARDLPFSMKAFEHLEVSSERLFSTNSEGERN
jgi:hypothetical protein